MPDATLLLWGLLKKQGDNVSKEPTKITYSFEELESIRDRMPSNALTSRPNSLPLLVIAETKFSTLGIPDVISRRKSTPTGQQGGNRNGCAVSNGERGGSASRHSSREERSGSYDDRGRNRGGDRDIGKRTDRRGIHEGRNSMGEECRGGESGKDHHHPLPPHHRGDRDQRSDRRDNRAGREGGRRRSNSSKKEEEDLWDMPSASLSSTRPPPPRKQKDDIWDTPVKAGAGGGKGGIGASDLMPFVQDDDLTATFEAERARYLGQDKVRDLSQGPAPLHQQEKKGEREENDDEDDASPAWADEPVVPITKSSSSQEQQQQPQQQRKSAPPGLSSPEEPRQPPKPLSDLEIDIDSLFGSSSKGGDGRNAGKGGQGGVSSFAGGKSNAVTSLGPSASESLSNPFQGGIFSFAPPGANLSTIDLYRELTTSSLSSSPSLGGGSLFPSSLGSKGTAFSAAASSRLDTWAPPTPQPPRPIVQQVPSTSSSSSSSSSQNASSTTTAATTKTPCGLLAPFSAGAAANKSREQGSSNGPPPPRPFTPPVSITTKSNVPANVSSLLFKPNFSKTSPQGNGLSSSSSSSPTTSTPSSSPQAAAASGIGEGALRAMLGLNLDNSKAKGLSSTPSSAAVNGGGQQKGGADLMELLGFSGEATRKEETSKSNLPSSSTVTSSAATQPPTKASPFAFHESSPQGSNRSIRKGGGTVGRGALLAAQSSRQPLVTVNGQSSSPGASRPQQHHQQSQQQPQQQQQQHHQQQQQQIQQKQQSNGNLPHHHPPPPSHVNRVSAGRPVSGMQPRGYALPQQQPPQPTHLGPYPPPHLHQQQHGPPAPPPHYPHHYPHAPPRPQYYSALQPRPYPPQSR